MGRTATPAAGRSDSSAGPRPGHPWTARLSVAYLLIVVLGGAFAPILAHDAPLLVEEAGVWRSPVAESLDGADVLALGLGVAILLGLAARSRPVLAVGLVLASLLGAALLAPRMRPKNVAAERFAGASFRLPTPLPSGPEEQRLASALRLLPPLEAREHPLGTDGLGRDVLARLLHGLRTSLLLATATTVAVAVLGVLLGSLAALGPRVLDRILDALLQALAAVPGLLALLALRGARSVGPLALGLLLGLLMTPSTARLVRDGIRRIRREPFVEAAYLLGQSRWAVLRGHLLPHVLAPVLVQGAFAFSGAVLAEATLSFLGLTPGGRPSLGALVAEGQSAFLRTPTTLAIPALLLAGWLGSLQGLAEVLRRRWEPGGGASR